MRFIDYDGSGGLDSRDIATSIVVESAGGNSASDVDDEAPTGAPHAGNVGCAGMAVLAVVAASLSLIALLGA